MTKEQHHIIIKIALQNLVLLSNKDLKLLSGKHSAWITKKYIKYCLDNIEYPDKDYEKAKRLLSKIAKRMSKNEEVDKE